MKTNLNHKGTSKRYDKLLNTVNFCILNIRNFFCTHPILVLSLLMGGTALYVFYPFLFEKQIFLFSDVGSDTKNVYYPFFISLARKLEQGDFSLWDFNYGMGVNILTRQADVGSVFTYIICALGKSGIKYALVIVHVLKIFLSGYLCYLYLNTFKFTTMSKVLVAYIYAFNGFIILWGQHYFMSSASICIILMLLSIELAFKSSKGLVFTAISTFLVMCTSYYFAYMVLLFSGMYVLLRLCYLYSKNELRKAVRNAAELLCAVFVGACLSAVIFIPSVYIVMSTSARLGGDSDLFSRILEHITLSFDEITRNSIVSRIFSNNLMGTEDFVGPYNYYELPQWFFSSFILFMGINFVCELFLDRNENIKRKVIKIVGLMLILTAAFQPFISFVFNGFVTAFFRYTYLFMPVLGLCYANVLDKLVYNKLVCAKLEIFIAGFIAFWVMSDNIYNINTSSRTAQSLGYTYLFMLTILVMLSLIVQGANKDSIRRIVCVVGVCVLIVTNIGIESFVTNNERLVTTEIEPDIYMTSGNDSVQLALSELQKIDDTFYRTEKTFRDITYLNDSMLQGYYGVSTYNSVINRNLIEFKNQVCPRLQITAAEGYHDFQQIVDDVNVVSLLGVKYILSLEYIDNIPEYQYLKSVDNVHIYQNTETTGIGKFFVNAVDRETFLSLEQEEKNELITDTLVIDRLDKNVTGGEAGESRIVFETPTNSSLVKGTADVKEDGWIFVSIPYEDGWKAYVDGSETEIVQADFGFWAIRVNKGIHDITLRYQTPYLVEGAIVSCMGIVFLAIGCIVVNASTKKKLSSERAVQ